MRFRLLGYPADGPTLDLDHRRFSYAGKFVMSNTGKAVARSERAPDPGVVGAVAFNADRTDDDVWWLRYITVRRDRRGEGVGPRLAGFVAERVLDDRAERLRIAVNNPFAYQALYKAGFGFTGEHTGLAELVLERPAPAGRDPERYRAGLAAYLDREDLEPAARRYAADRRDGTPPDRIRTPDK